MNNQQCNDFSCNCQKCAATDDPLRGMPIGMGYVPIQEWGCTYCPDKALQQGTIFPPLDLPFYGCIPKGFCPGKGARS